MNKARPLIVYQAETVGPIDFVKYWSRLSQDPREDLYVGNIDRPFTVDKVGKLYEWKNGGRLSAGKRRSVEINYIARIAEVEGLDPTITPQAFLEQFGAGGAIWRIFWLHCWQPKRFPIYDQHVHRAMTLIEDGKIVELDRVNDKGKIRLYIDRYLGFCETFKGLDQREVDRALWTFGKFIKRFPQFAKMSLGCA